VSRLLSCYIICSVILVKVDRLIFEVIENKLKVEVV
jgi:hypothetical protein